MREIISHSIPFKDILSDLATEMNTEFHQSCEEYILKIPKEYGEGQIRGINFPEGIGLLMYDCTFNEDTEFQFIVDEVHPLKFMFCEEGGFLHRFQDSEDNHKVEVLQNIIVASSKNKGHIIRFKKSIKTRINNLEIDRKKFKNLLSCEIKKLKPGLRSLFQDVNGRNYFYHLGNYSLRTAEIFSKIHDFKGSSFQENILLHGQSYNIFFIQILEYYDAKSPENKQGLIRKRELELIRQAALIINSEIKEFKSVGQLAVEVGLNNNKLQAGFREVYGMTVNQFVQQKRLDKAEILIKNTDLDFSEIAYRVGIGSKSYFSKIFKDKYGLTPSEIRKQRKYNSSVGIKMV